MHFSFNSFLPSVKSGQDRDREDGMKGLACHVFNLVFIILFSHAFIFLFIHAFLFSFLQLFK